MFRHNNFACGLCLSIVALTATMWLYNICREGEWIKRKQVYWSTFQDRKPSARPGEPSILLNLLRVSSDAQNSAVFPRILLQCLNRMAAHHAGDGEFECPTCRATTLKPQPEGTFDLCASSFLHNRLLDLLAIKEARNTPTLCGDCGKTASDCSYCFGMW